MATQSDSEPENTITQFPRAPRSRSPRRHEEHQHQLPLTPRHKKQSRPSIATPSLDALNVPNVPSVALTHPSSEAPTYSATIDEPAQTEHDENSTDQQDRRPNARNLEDYPSHYYWTWHSPHNRYYTWIENDANYGTWWTIWFNHGNLNDYTWISHQRMAQWSS